jgi:uncharacterized protein YcgI (DUF1989 family)
VKEHHATGTPSSVRVPAGDARGVRVSSGATLRVRDLAGAQVGDLFAFNAHDPAEHLSASHTRAWTRRLFPDLGQPFISTLRQPMLTLVADTSPGVHDMLIAACDPARYAQLGASADHRSCAMNLRGIAAEFGFAVPVIPQPVNVFMNTPARADGSIEWLVSPSRAGDEIVFRAEMDLVVVVSSCPMDILEISGGGLTDLELGVDQ